MNFETNNEGGWIVPANTDIPPNTQIPDYSELDNDCTLGDGCELGNGCTLGSWCILGDRCKLGNRCILGNHCELGDYCILGSWCMLGNGCELGNRCILENVTVHKFMTLANVDGTGRQILLIKHDGGILVRAGCFVGTVEAFCEKAESEGKHFYSKVIKCNSDLLLTFD